MAIGTSCHVMMSLSSSSSSSDVVEPDDDNDCNKLAPELPVLSDDGRGSTPNEPALPLLRVSGRRCSDSVCDGGVEINIAGVALGDGAAWP